MAEESVLLASVAAEQGRWGCYELRDPAWGNVAPNELGPLAQKLQVRFSMGVDIVFLRADNAASHPDGIIVSHVRVSCPLMSVAFSVAEQRAFAFHAVLMETRAAESGAQAYVYARCWGREASHRAFRTAGPGITPQVSRVA